MCRRRVRSFASEFIDTGYLIALSAAGVVYLTAFITKGPISLRSMALGFFLVLSVYAADRAASNTTQASKSTHRNWQKPLRLATAVVALVVAVLMPLLCRNNLALIVILLMLLTGLLYGVFFKGLSRRVPGFKSLFVSLEWTALAVLYCVYESVPITSGVLLFAGWLFLQDVVNTSICDIKDLDADRRDGIRTLAAVLGPQRLCRLMHTVNLLTVAVAFLALTQSSLLAYFPWFVATSIYTYLYVQLVSSRGRGAAPTWVYSVMADSIYVAAAAFVTAGQWIGWH